MERGLFNIGSAATTTLVSQDTGVGTVQSISICNCNQDEDVKIRLFLNDGTNETSILEDLNIPGGVTLFLNEGLSFDTSVLSMQLQTQGTGVDVNVIMK
jgi:hypothetical protein